MVQFWTIFAAAFLASAVEFVEAFTIVLTFGLQANSPGHQNGIAIAALVPTAALGVPP